MLDIPKVYPSTTPVENNPVKQDTKVKPVPVEERIPQQVKKPAIDRRRNPDRRKGNDANKPLVELRHKDRRKSSIDISV